MNSKRKDIVNEKHEIEKITTIIRNKVYIFEEQWGKWLR